jgi:hypothetical protein
VKLRPWTVTTLVKRPVSGINGRRRRDVLNLRNAGRLAIASAVKDNMEPSPEHWGYIIRLVLEPTGYGGVLSGVRRSITRHYPR